MRVFQRPALKLLQYSDPGVVEAKRFAVMKAVVWTEKLFELLLLFLKSGFLLAFRPVTTSLCLLLAFPTSCFLSVRLGLGLWRQVQEEETRTRTR